MNRYEVYDELAKTMNTYSVIVNRRPYNKLYIPWDWTCGILQVNDMFINGVNHCYICSDELVVRDKLAMMQINIKYRDIEVLKIYESED